MGRSIDLYSYDYNKLKTKIADYCKTDNLELIEKVLSSCGNKMGDRYIILNQEFWEDASCYYNVANILDKIFKVDDTFGNVFCTFDDSETDRQELISAIEIYEVKEELNLDIDEDE